MVVGVATIELRLHGVHSLKDKRGVVRRVVHRIKNQFEISAAEVGLMDVHHAALIGCAVVTNDTRLANSLIDQIFEFVTELHLAEVVRTEFELLHY